MGFLQPVLVLGMPHVQFDLFPGGPGGPRRRSHPQKSWAHRREEHEADVEPPGVGAELNSQDSEPVQNKASVGDALSGCGRLLLCTLLSAGG